MTTSDVEKMIEYHDKRIKEIWALFEATDKQMKETDQQMKETDQKINLLSDKMHELTDQWGRFVENFLVPGIPTVFQKRGIPIVGTSVRVKRRLKGENIEIDILAVNTEYVVLIEAKNLMKVDYVRRHLKKLARFKEFFPEYRDKQILGAVAATEFASDSDDFAMSEGLFVIGLGDDLVQITNQDQFLPRIW